MGRTAVCAQDGHSLYIVLLGLRAARYVCLLVLFMVYVYLLVFNSDANIR